MIMTMIMKKKIVDQCFFSYILYTFYPHSTIIIDIKVPAKIEFVVDITPDGCFTSTAHNDFRKIDTQITREKTNCCNHCCKTPTNFCSEEQK